MSYLKERVAYLKGLSEGMQIDDASNEGKLLKAIIDVLDDIALSVEDVEDIQDELSQQVDTIDEDLAEIEKIVYEEEECDCGCHDHDDDEDEDLMADIECPHCKQEVTLNLEEVDEDTDTIECPNCHEKIEIEWDCSCDECEDDDEEDK